MIHYREFRHWSPMLGCNAARIMMADQWGQEYFAIVKAESPGYRDRRDDAVIAITRAIECGFEPGEVFL